MEGDSRPAGEPLDGRKVRDLATAGVIIVGIRGVVLRVLGLAGNIVVARLLAPEDFGLVAFGLAFLAVGKFLSSGGLAAGLVRRSEEPSVEELRSMVAIQLAFTITLVLLVVVVAAAVGGRAGAVTAVMVAALPLYSFRTPGVVILERALDFKPLARVEVTETFFYNVWAITTVAVGWGVWGLATASVVRIVVGTGLMVRYGPTRALRPFFSWTRVRPLLGFGLRFQAVGAANIARDQGLNFGTAAIAGLGALGVWTLARRVLEIPFLLFDSLFRVSFPAMSRLVSAGEDPRPVIERAVGVASVVTGLVVVPLVGSTPALIPAVFGTQWTEATDVVPFACMALMVGGPVSIATAGYLYAVGAAQAVLRATLTHTAVWLTVGLGLLPVLGVPALGLGWMASSLVDARLLGSAASSRTGVRLVAPVAGPLAVALPAAGAGWLLASTGSGLLEALAGGSAALALYITCIVVFRRAQAGDAIRLVRQGIAQTFAARQAKADDDQSKSASAV